MEMDLQALIKDLGVPVALLLYFAYKDFKFTGRIVELMARLDSVLENLRKESPRKDDAA